MVPNHRLATVVGHLCPAPCNSDNPDFAADDNGTVTTELHHDGQILVIRLDRPKQLNGFTPKMFLELGKAFSLLESGSARVGVLCGSGRHFCAGIDMERNTFDAKMFPVGEVDPAGLYPPLRTKPLIAVCQGVCFTVGLEIALAADMIVATPKTRFGQVEVKRGIMSFFGGTQRLMERAGYGWAMRYVLTGDEFNGTEAHRVGIVQELAESAEEAVAKGMELATKIAAQAPLAVQASLHSAHVCQQSGMAASTNLLAGQVRKLRSTKDFAEGVKSFAEKRDGAYKGE